MGMRNRIRFRQATDQQMARKSAMTEEKEKKRTEEKKMKEKETDK